MTSKRLLLVLSAVIPLLLVAAPAGADDSGGGVGAPEYAPAPVPTDAAVPDAEPAQTETTPTTPGGEEQPDGNTVTETTPGGTVGPEVQAPQTGAGESAGGLPRTGLEVAAFAMIGLGLLMAGLALRPTSSWPPPRDRLSRSTPHRW